MKLYKTDEYILPSYQRDLQIKRLHIMMKNIVNIMVVVLVLMLPSVVRAQDETTGPCYLEFECQDMYDFLHEGKHGKCCNCHCTFPGDQPRCEIGC